ncbi:MAG: YdbL family protein, partial [Desulfobacterales bacterium]
LVVMIADAISASDNIKQRMIDRLPIIKALKNKGVVGENNMGFLEFIGDQEEKADVVTAENKDRKAVYEAIAKKQGTTAEVVGKHRAAQISGKALAGEWLQDANGKWYQKK